MIPESLKQLLRNGHELFLQGKHWEAHHDWELAWKELEQPAKTYVQGLILAAAAFHLDALGRAEAATRAAANALVKLAAGPEVPELARELEIQGLEERLRRLSAEP